MKTQGPTVSIVNTRRGSSIHQSADQDVEGVDCLVWEEGVLFMPNGQKFDGTRLNRVHGAEAMGFPNNTEAEATAIRQLLEFGRDSLGADAYELTGTTVSLDDENQGKYFAYATAIFYRS